MITESITKGKLPPGMNKDSLLLLPKDGDLEYIQNW